MSGHAHALAFGVEKAVLQKTANMLRYMVCGSINKNQCVIRVAKALFEKVTILREKRRTVQRMQKRDDVFVRYSSEWNLFPNLSELDSPPSRQFSLVLPDILIQQNHAARLTSACFSLPSAVSRLACAS